MGLFNSLTQSDLVGKDFSCVIVCTVDNFEKLVYARVLWSLKDFGSGSLVLER